MKNKTSEYLTMSKYIVYCLFELIAMMKRGKMDGKGVKNKKFMRLYTFHAFGIIIHCGILPLLSPSGNKSL